MFDNKKYKSINKRIIKEYNLIREKNKRSLLCHAPFSTLFFTEYGEILPCYYNKNIVFGNYPDNTPEEAWFGKKTKVYKFTGQVFSETTPCGEVIEKELSE